MKHRLCINMQGGAAGKLVNRRGINRAVYG